jgi:multiple sugar transport system permease protein
MIITSLKATAEIFVFPPVFIPHLPQWNNYVEAMKFAPFGRYYLNSLFLCIMVVSGTLISNILIAYGFSRVKWVGRDVVFVIVLATMMLPAQVTMIPVYIIFRKLGWIGSYLPLIVPAYMGSAYFTFLLRQFFRGIPFELSDAARIDGCSEVGILWYIILPLAKPALVMVTLFAFIGTWNDFLGPLIYLHDSKLFTVTLGLQSFISRYWTPMNLMMAAATVAIIPVLLVFIWAQRFFVEGISITGLGGR